MGVYTKQLDDGSLGLSGVDNGAGAFVVESIGINATSPATQVIFTAHRSMRVKGLRYRVEVSGTGGACTFVVNKAPSGTAISAGTILHTGTFNVAGTAATLQTGTLSATSSALTLAAGDSVGVIITGTATSAVGALSIWASPL